MTQKQEQAVRRIRREVESGLFYSTRCELKEFTVKEYDTFVSVVFEVGQMGDEGTLAAVFARDRGHVFVGTRGGITYPVHKGSKTVYRQYKRPISVVVDQRI